IDVQGRVVRRRRFGGRVIDRGRTGRPPRGRRAERDFAATCPSSGWTGVVRGGPVRTDSAARPAPYLPIPRCFLPCPTTREMTRSPMTALLVACAISAPLAAQTKPFITPKDYGKWESMTSARLAPRGDWVAVGINRVNEENELRLRGGPRDTTVVVA